MTFRDRIRRVFPRGPSNVAPFVFTGLEKQDRHDIVTLNVKDPARAFLTANQFELTALGANVDVTGSWNPAASSAINLVHFAYHASLGRTVSQVVQRRGYLYPLGHAAIMTATTQRVIVSNTGETGDAGQIPVSYLEEVYTIRVTEPVKTYPAPGQPFAESAGTSDWPFSSVRILTVLTPEVQPPQHSEPIPSGSESSSSQGIWPVVRSSGRDVQWKFVATDLGGNEVHFSMPLAFIYGNDKATPGFSSEFDTTNGSLAVKLAGDYDQRVDGQDPKTWSYLNAAPMRFAPEVASGAPGATTHPTLIVQLGVARTNRDPNAPTAVPPNTLTTAELEAAGQPNFYPVIANARIRLHAAEVLTGGEFTDSGANDPNADFKGVGGVRIQYYENYVTAGSATFGHGASDVHPHLVPNLGAVYAQAVNQVPLNLPASTVGGVGTPNTSIAGLTALDGYVGGSTASAADIATSLQGYAQMAVTEATQYFSSIVTMGEAAIGQLLGQLSLSNILNPITNQLLGADQAKALSVARGRDVRPHDNYAQFLMPTVNSLIDPITGSHKVTYTLVTPLTQQWPSSGDAIFWPGDLSTSGGPTPAGTPPVGNFTMTTTIEASTDGSAPTYQVNGSIDPFWINLAGVNGSDSFIQFHFASLTFQSGSGSSPTVNVNLDQVLFRGDLEFVNTLASLLENLGGSGLSIDVEPTYVSASISVSVPDLAVGILSLSGLSFAGSVQIPFLSGPAIASFAIASSDNPFTITVAMFGGGGFLNVAAGFGGIQSLQASFEFTGSFALDVVVASGSVSLSAGIYFSMKGSDAKLSGFIKITGQLQILGIVTITAELDLSLSYDTDTGCAVGTATFTASITVCGFSKSVSFSYSKSFGGSKAPPPPLPMQSGIPHLATPRALSPSTILATDLLSQTDWNNYCAAFAA